MSEVLHKFPSTPHLVWLGKGRVRGDKVMTHAEATEFLAGPITVEEKVDGANLGLSLDEDGKVRWQNRGQWLEGKLTSQWERIRSWTAKHEMALRKELPKRHVLFGEWCYAVHSIRYDHLPDWFLAFDVYDFQAHRFWSSTRRNGLAAKLGMATVPRIKHGTFSQAELRAMLNPPSKLHDGPREGLYLRREDKDWLIARAKLVWAEFSQSISFFLAPMFLRQRQAELSLGSLHTVPVQPWSCQGTRIER